MVMEVRKWKRGGKEGDGEWGGSFICGYYAVSAGRRENRG